MKWGHVSVRGRALRFPCVLLGIFWGVGMPAAFSQESAQSQPSAAGSDVALVGHVVDQQDHPVPSARVTLSSHVMGGCLSSALTAMASTTADSDGRFVVRLPFAGIRYNLLIERPGYEHKYLAVMGGVDRSTTVRLPRGGETKDIGGRVVDAEGKPVSRARVTGVGEYGWAAVTTSSHDGGFRFKDAPDQRQVVFYAEAGGLISPLYQTARDKGDLILRLGPPAVVRGTVAEMDSEKGLPGITVHIRVPYMNDFRMSATSASDGTFVMPQVPPGEYVLEAVTETTHFDRPPHGWYYDRSTLVAVAGETVNRFVEMLQCARLRGQVTDRDGHPVPDALVGTRCSWMGSYEHEQNRLVKADDEGRFELATGHLNETLDVWAFAGRHGLGRVRVPEMREGESRDGVDIRLPGMIHIRGRVVDPEGKPIPDVVCEDIGLVSAADRTNAAGDFDLGFVPIHAGPNAEQYLICHAPRSYGQDPILPRYYLHKKVPHARDPGDLDLRVTLDPTEWLTISGTITDEQGVLRSGIHVRLFDGVASRFDEDDGLSPDDDWRAYGHGGVHVDFPLAFARTDNRGVFRLKLLRETPESLRIVKGGEVDGTSFKLVVDREVRKGVERAAQVIENVVVPAGQTELQLTVRLQPPTSEPYPRGPWSKSGSATAPATQDNSDPLIYP